LGELLSIGNSKDQAGNYLFSGTQTKTEPFRITEGRIAGGSGDRVVGVDYLGNVDSGVAEISEGATAQTHLIGTRVFWAEQQQIYSTVDAGQYRVQRDSAIRIDGTQIQLTTGDTVSAVVAKINDANVAVRARIDPVANGLVLETTSAHQIAAEDLGGGTVLQDLGILAPGGTHPPLNVSPTAHVFGGSVFDQIIALRDALYEGSSEKVGTAGLRGIENAVTAMAGSLGDLGARDARLDVVGKRVAYMTPDLQGIESQIHDLDMADAITRLKTLESTNEAALSATARALNRPKLLDFLR
ncbi:MAG TPA: flagellar hook-associated protein FlgL, partial [Spirochaetia bacterium]|nr:flagellar hook-associated protein FlgL [Spirochaetia bacterium]